LPAARTRLTPRARRHKALSHGCGGGAVKIERMRLVVFERPLPGDVSNLTIKGQSIAPYVSNFVAVQLVTDEGAIGEAISGYGGLSLAHSIADRIRPFVLGSDPGLREGLWQELWRLDRLLYTTQFAIGTVDVALWDLYGRIVGEPLYRLLGGVRDKIPAYASGMSFSAPQGFVDDALAHRDRGYQGYKLHTIGDPVADIAACQAVRDAVGPDYCLMVDVAGEYNQQQALLVGRELDQLGYHWYEEPLRDFDLHGYKMLADKLDLPIVAGEVMPGALYTTPEYILTRAIDTVRGDVSFKGGVGQLRKLGALAEAFGLNIEIHTNANSHIDAANLHVAAAMANTEFFEQLVPAHFFNFEVCEEIVIDHEGFAHVPQGPGLGMTIDWDFIERYKVAEL
jgi:L-alanine-DL-glutamate epimerase-like enolase superfamily enzyme